MDNDNIRAEVIKLTPELAAMWLTRNTHNRRLDRNRVSVYAETMAAGDWVLNGEAISFGPDGRMHNGQHRCAACVKAGVPIEVLVVYGLDDAAQETMDRGKGRTVADVLQLRGEKSAQILAGALAWIKRMETGNVSSGSFIFTPQEAIRLLEAHPGMRDVGPIIDPASRRMRLLDPSPAWALAYRFASIDYDDAVDFFEKLANGANLNENDPILRLRNALLAEKTKVRNRTKRWIIIAMTIKAWNFYRDGAEVKILKFSAGGAHPEGFPEPH